MLKNIKNINRRKFAPGLLMLATFLNPAGFTDLFKLIMTHYSLTYDFTHFIFYLLSGFVYVLYCFVLNLNPLTALSRLYRIYKIGYEKALHYRKLKKNNNL